MLRIHKVQLKMIIYQDSKLSVMTDSHLGAHRHSWVLRMSTGQVPDEHQLGVRLTAAQNCLYLDAYLNTSFNGSAALKITYLSGVVCSHISKNK